MAPSKVSLKLLIDRNGKKVLFAEAGKDFIDFLFSILTLPVGTIFKLFDNKDMVGGLAKLYQSVTDLNDEYLQPNQKKDVLLKPKSLLPFVSPQVPLLPLEEWSSSSPNQTAAAPLYRCGSCKNDLLSPVSRRCSSCSYGHMNVAVTDYVPKSFAEGGGFVKGNVTYMVMDDLCVSPMSTISIISLWKKFNIKNMGELEEKVVHISMDEGLELLKYSLNSNTVLTNVFLGEVANKDENPESGLKHMESDGCGLV